MTTELQRYVESEAERTRMRLRITELEALVQEARELIEQNRDEHADESVYCISYKDGKAFLSKTEPYDR